MAATLVQSLRDSWGFLLFAGVLAASLSANVALAIRQPLPSVVREAGVQPGSMFPTLKFTDLDGRAEHLQFDSKTVVYVFSPTCDWCKRDYPNLMAIYGAAGARIPFVALTLTSRPQLLRRYLDGRPFPGRVLVADVAGLDAALMETFGLTPQLLVVDAGGRIQRAWPGALMDQKQRQVEDLFHVRLPGPAGLGVDPSTQ